MTPVTCAVNPALKDPLATVTVAGTVTAELELEIETFKPPVPGAVETVTVQLSLPLPVTEELVQLNPVNWGELLADALDSPFPVNAASVTLAL